MTRKIPLNSSKQLINGSRVRCFQSCRTLVAPKLDLKLAGLRALNEAGIIHRDISNGNLMLPSPDDQPKQASIIDFGLAHWTRETIEGQGETMEGQQDDMLSQDSNRGPKWSPQPHFHVSKKFEPFFVSFFVFFCVFFPDFFLISGFLRVPYPLSPTNC